MRRQRTINESDQGCAASRDPLVGSRTHASAIESVQVPLVEMRGITKSYGKRRILDSLDLAFPARSVTALVGPSGTGKSTLLDLLGLLEAPSSGELFFRGRPAPRIFSREAVLLRRRTINYLFQSNALISGKSVMDNIMIALHYAPVKSRAEKRRLTSDVLTELGLSGCEDMPVNVLSGGEQQRVAIARCILKPGDLVLADEPTGSLDHHLAHNVFSQILSMRNVYHKTIIVVTHDHELAACCDRVVELRPT